MTVLEPQPVAITIIGGFLGAGKTTLINHLVRSAIGTPIAVLVNDFGELNIDAELIVGVEGGVIRLSNGCICCTIRNDVTTSILQLIESKEAPRHIFVETSGISDPRAVAQAIVELQRAVGGIRLDGVIIVADAENFGATRTASGELLSAQLLGADVVILNKCDLVDEPKRDEIVGAIRAQVPHARILFSAHAKVPLDAILCIETESPHALGIPALSLDVHEHESMPHGMISWCFEETEPLSWGALVQVLTTLPHGVLRIKGIMNLKERAGDRIILHVVGRRIDVRTIEAWGTRTPKTQLVLIGLAGSFDPEDIEARFRATCRG